MERKPGEEGWRVIEDCAARLLEKLDIPDEYQAWVHNIRREGKRPGHRITVTRLRDGLTATEFIPD